MKKAGGARANSGRKPGIPNKITGEVKELAREHGPAAISRLAFLLTQAQSEQAQVAAAKELLDRAYGKSIQYNETTIKREAQELSEDELLRIAAGGSPRANPAEEDSQELPPVH